MKNQSEFTKLFKYEIQNRAMSYAAMQVMVRKNITPGILKWFEAYLEFEILNQNRYSPVAAKYHIDVKPEFSTKLTVSLLRLAYYIVPQKTIWNYALKETAAYVAQLERLRDIAPEEDTVFFDYVVAQEKLQVETITLRLEDDLHGATDVFKCFVSRHQSASDTQ